MHAWCILIWHLGDRMHPVVLTIIPIHRYMQSNVLIFGLESVLLMCSFDWWKKRLFWWTGLGCDVMRCDAMWYDVIWCDMRRWTVTIALKLLSEHRMCMRTDAREWSEPIDRRRCIVKLFQSGSLEITMISISDISIASIIRFSWLRHEIC